MHLLALMNAMSLRLLPTPQILLDRLDHLIAHFGRVGELRLEIRLHLLELGAVAFHIAQGDALAPVLHVKGRQSVHARVCVTERYVKGVFGVLV